MKDYGLSKMSLSAKTSNSFEDSQGMHGDNKDNVEGPTKVSSLPGPPQEAIRDYEKKYSNLSDLKDFFKGVDNYVVLKLTDEFPNYFDHSNIDILCRNRDGFLKHILSVGQAYEKKGFQLKVNKTDKHLYVDFYPPAIKRLNLRFDLLDSLSYERFSLDPQFSEIILDNRQWVNHDGIDIRVPSLEHDLAIRFFDYIEWLGKRPDNLKHREYIKKHYRPDFTDVVNKYTNLFVSVKQANGTINLNVSAKSEGVKQLINERKTGPVRITELTTDILSQLKASGLWREGQPLRLHLGCGQNHLDGYINVDYPPEEHNVMTQLGVNLYADITELSFPPQSVDEIKLQHVFEHFSRVAALAMLIKWQDWLKIGGKLHIETPDLIGSAKTLISNASWKIKMGVVRHLAGDQSAGWGYHVDHWFPERFEYTLSRLGFKSIRTVSSSWTKEPYLSNVKVVALKAQHISLQQQLNVAEQLLWESTVAPKERPTWEVWKKQLRGALAGDFVPTPGNIQTSTERQATKPILGDWVAEGDLVFDVGAHLGLKTDMYLMKGARVVCFEPQPECVRLLRQKYQNNRKVTIVDKGLTDKPGQRQLLVCSSAPTISTFSEQWLTGRFADYSWDKVIPAEVTTLDEMIETYGHPKFCKIDVEGFEFEVLKGLSQLIPYLSFEFTIEFLENAKKCVAHLQDLGYKHFNLGLEERPELVFSKWVSSETLFHHIEHLDNKLLWGDIYAKANDPESVGIPELAGDLSASPSNTQTPNISSVSAAPIVLSQNSSQLPLDEIHDFNQRSRDRWVRAKAKTIPVGSRVLDIGAGTCPYRSLFVHCDYKTHDFKKYKGVKLGNTKEYSEIDYESDITSIPVPDKSFDVILCTEVLEHVPEPIEALREMARILRRGGQLFITAPLGSGLHQTPYHYYDGYTPQWYKSFLPKFGLDVKEISPNGGFFKLLAQECARVQWTLPQHQHLHGSNVEFIRHLFGEWLPRYLYALDEQCFIDQFTVGYHIEAEKLPVPVLDKKDIYQPVSRNI